MWNTVVNIAYITMLRVSYLLTPEQIASSIYTFLKDRLLLNVGTPDPSQMYEFIYDFLGHQYMMNRRHDSWRSNPIGTECYGQDGGKIIDKAKASSNFRDTK
jgi:hypothetical protein